MSSYTDEVPLGDMERGPAVSWKDQPLGTKVEGIVVASRRVQQTDYDTGELLTWNDGSARMQTLVQLELGTGDVVSLYASGGKFSADGGEGEGTSLEGAIAGAVRKAGDDRIRKGARLTVTLSGHAKPRSNKYKPANLFTATYVPPTEELAVAGLFSDAEG